MASKTTARRKCLSVTKVCEEASNYFIAELLASNYCAVSIRGRKRKYPKVV